jgi:hypothetical protein
VPIWGIQGSPQSHQGHAALHPGVRTRSHHSRASGTLGIETGPSLNPVFWEPGAPLLRLVMQGWLRSLVGC